MSAVRQIGFIGLGMMGGSMVRTLLKAGHALTVFDIDQGKMDSLKGLGALPVSSLAEVSKKCDIIFSSLPNPATVREVYTGPEGVIQRSSPGTILVDMSTVDPETSRSMYKLAALRNVKYLDAPVSGGPKEAENGKLTVMVGGDEEAFGKCKDIFAILGSTVHYAGFSGAGNIIKLINNVMVLGSVLIAAEAFVLGVKAGVGGQRLFDIIRTCGGQSPHLEKRFPWVLARDFEPRFTVDLAKKDLGIALEMAKNLGVPIPATSLIHQLYSMTSCCGDGQKDFVSIVKLFECWAGTQVISDKK